MTSIDSHSGASRRIRKSVLDELLPDQNRRKPKHSARTDVGLRNDEGQVVNVGDDMHRMTLDVEKTARAILDFVIARQRQDPWPLGGSKTPEELQDLVGDTITPEGLGATEAFRQWAE